MDLFSQVPELIEPKTDKTLIDRVNTQTKYKSEITVNTLSNSAIQKFIDQGKEVTVTPNGIIIKY